MNGDRWVHVTPIEGGQVVVCTLCGKSTKRLFSATDTNYAEALRLATAYGSTHRLSEVHRAALAAFHADEAPEVNSQEELLAKIFGQEPPDEHQRRRRAARDAARRAQKEATS